MCSPILFLWFVGRRYQVSLLNVDSCEVNPPAVTFERIGLEVIGF